MTPRFKPFTVEIRLLVLQTLVFTGTSIEIDNKPRTYSSVEEQLVAGSSHFRSSEMIASTSTGNKTEKSTSNESQNSRKRKNAGSSCNPGMETK